MPNLTSYHAPSIHSNRELPKTYCDLIRHEIDYNHFLRTRIANMHSSLSFTNKKHFIPAKNIPRRRYYDHNQRLFHVYQHNLQLCKKILEIWTNNGKQQGGVDCHNENYRKQLNISHFRLRQKQCKDKIENENKRFIHSMIYHRKKYQPIHDRSTAYKDFEKHLKLLKTMSQYPKYILTNPVHKNLFNYDNLPEYAYYNFSQFYNLKPNTSLQTSCQALPRSYKLIKQKASANKTKSNKQIKTPMKSTYVENFIQQTLNDAIYIYNQSFPSISTSVKSLYTQNNQRSKSRSYQQQKPFHSVSCRQLLEPWSNTRRSKKTPENIII
ncbi:unnamed protein product [Adineta steineri]|uniref:Uncharacterized protein n=1 Tax=Adineta steineri TaxID=433720 RepID=A0A814BM34_9BILA|nr:unnamed protein product [Adineta steineri]CAF0873518.1 unnamed protein product [Adineta steineri]CAF0928606.1 unnamed protein product [Adineta steineri]